VRTTSSSTSSAFVLALLLAAVPPAGAQAVRSNATAVVPFWPDGPAGRQNQDRAQRPPNVALYATAFLGPGGTVDGVTSEASRGFHYAAVHLLFSAAALPTGRQADRSVIGDLQRLSAQVTLTPLDSLQQPIQNGAALQLLAILPDTSIAPGRRPPGDSGSTRVETALLSVTTRALMPELQAGVGAAKRVGPLVASFANLYHRPTARLQVPYVADDRVFGWLWHAHETDVIEGTHRGSAAIEVNAATRYVRVQMRLIGEWQSRGAWQRDMDIVLNVTAAP
jgi:hypothetical protein